MSAFLPLTMDLTRFTVLIGLEWVLALVVIPSLARMRCVTASPVELLPAVGSPSQPDQPDTRTLRGRVPRAPATTSV